MDLVIELVGELVSAILEITLQNAKCPKWIRIVLLSIIMLPIIGFLAIGALKLAMKDESLGAVIFLILAIIGMVAYYKLLRYQMERKKDDKDVLVNDTVVEEDTKELFDDYGDWTIGNEYYEEIINSRASK